MSSVCPCACVHTHTHTYVHTAHTHLPHIYCSTKILKIVVTFNLKHKPCRLGVQLLGLDDTLIPGVSAGHSEPYHPSCTVVLRHQHGGGPDLGHVLGPQWQQEPWISTWTLVVVRQPCWQLRPGSQHGPTPAHSLSLQIFASSDLPLSRGHEPFCLSFSSIPNHTGP